MLRPLGIARRTDATIGEDVTEVFTTVGAGVHGVAFSATTGSIGSTFVVTAFASISDDSAGGWYSGASSMAGALPEQ